MDQGADKIVTCSNGPVGADTTYLSALGVAKAEPAQQVAEAQMQFDGLPVRVVDCHVVKIQDIAL